MTGVADSGLPGPKGNREFFLVLRHRAAAAVPDELDSIEEWFEQEGKPLTVSGAGTGRVKIVVRDQATGRPTACRKPACGCW